VFFSDLPLCPNINRPFRFRFSELQRSQNDILSVPPISDLTDMSHVLTKYSRLINGVLKPVNELVSGPSEFSILGEGRSSGVDEDWCTTGRDIVHGSCEGLCTAILIGRHGLASTFEFRSRRRAKLTTCTRTAAGIPQTCAYP